LLNHSVLDQADDGHDNAATDGRSGDIADHPAVLQHAGHAKQLFAKTATKNPYDRVADRSKAEFFQNCAGNVSANTPLINPMSNCTIVLLIPSLLMRRDFHLGSPGRGGEHTDNASDMQGDSWCAARRLRAPPVDREEHGKQ
jgi:hypothetical protein